MRRAIAIDREPFFMRIPRLRFLQAMAICVVATGLLGFADYATGWELSFSIFYLLPVTLAVLMNGRALGIAISAVSAVVWALADLAAGNVYRSALYPIWNTLVRLG